MTPFAIGSLGIGILFVLLLLRQPVWLAMILCGIGGLVTLKSLGVAKFVVATTFFDQAQSYNLSIVPLFILMGEVASGSRMSSELFGAARALLSGLRGGLSVATIAASGAFGAICGSSVATAAAMTRISLPEMTRAGYSQGFSASSVAAGGTLGILIPPSIILVIYGSIAEQSVARLFAASMVPGIVLLMLYAVVAMVISSRKKAAPLDPPLPFWPRLRETIRPWHFILLFVVTIGGIYAGIFSPNEAASIGAFGAILLGFGRRTLTFRGLLRAVQASVLMSCALFMIIISATVFANFVVQTRLPDTLLRMALAADMAPWVIMTLIVAIYIVLGCFLEGIGMILITVPVFLPVVTGYGFDPVWFGVLVTVLVELGLITPPVGMNLFIIKAQAPELPMGVLYREITPFLIAPVALVIMLFALPTLALWLPGVLYR